MFLTRRDLIAGGVAAATAAAVAGPALALTEDQARSVIQATIDDLLAFLKGPGTAASRASQLRAIMERRANMPQIAKFSAGRVWLEMSEAQRARYQEAFAAFVSTTYARRFEEFTGNPNVAISQVINAGNKGFLVQTPVRPPQGEVLVIEWLVSDRGGRVEIVDIVVEGISLATTQREEIAALFESKGRSVDALIAELEQGA